MTGTGGAGNDCTALRSQFSASVMLNLLCTERHGGYCIDVDMVRKLRKRDFSTYIHMTESESQYHLKYRDQTNFNKFIIPRILIISTNE